MWTSWKFSLWNVISSIYGCEWGYKYVDEYFEGFLKEFFGEELFGIYKKNATGWLEILKHFELLKRNLILVKM